jgi:Universal stress protein family
MARTGPGIGSDPANRKRSRHDRSPRAGAGRIVVGVDGSPSSGQALRWDARAAAAFGAGLDAVTAWEFPAGYGFGSVPSGWDPEQDMRTVLDQTVQEVFGDQPPAGLRRLTQGAAGVVPPPRNVRPVAPI